MYRIRYTHPRRRAQLGRSRTLAIIYIHSHFHSQTLLAPLRQCITSRSAHQRTPYPPTKRRELHIARAHALCVQAEYTTQIGDQGSMSYHQQHPSHADQTAAHQAGYQAGYDAGFRAGYEAGTAAAATPSLAQQQQQGYNLGSTSSAMAAPPQLPYRSPPPPQVPPRIGQGAGVQQQVPGPHHPPPPPRPATNQQPQQQPARTIPPAAPHSTPQSSVWQPSVGSTFNYVLSHTIDLTHPSFPPSTASVWIVDLFDTPVSSISALHAAGCWVVAYFSAGSWEDWRPDKGGYGKKDLGKAMDGWKGERWVDVRSEGVRDVLKARLDLAREKGFDGVDPDNVDGWENKTGFKLAKGDCVEFVRWLAREAHSRGLSCGLKNGAGFVQEVLPEVEYVVVEEAVRYNETGKYMCVVEAGKPVWHVEYPKGEDEEDEKMNNERRVEGKGRERALMMRSKGWSSVIKNVRLDQWVQVD